MPQVRDGIQIKSMFTTATQWLELNVDAINSLNVFPVPDGDTGTNMLFTMRAAVAEAEKCPDSEISPMAKALAWGALMGARGNSGVILSQILRGFSDGLENKDYLDGKGFASALEQASTAAYKAVSKPVEGTILTVVRDASNAAVTSAQERADLEAVLEATIDAAKDSVASTPSLLPILKEAGAVDAGGQGLLTILEGLLKAVRGESIESAQRLEESDAIQRLSHVSSGTGGQEGHQAFGYCTEFLIHGRELDATTIKEEISQIGDSTVVVGDESTVRVHTHSFEPESVIGFAKSFGELSKVKYQNIDEQHNEILQANEIEEEQSISTIAVASGEGFKALFFSLGASRVVAGGQTMNPSTQEILTAIESVSSENIILLPNNKNIVPAAQQAASLSPKTVEVIPTSTIPQGIAFLLAFNLEAELNENVEGMKESFSGVKTLELTRAVRPANLNGVKVNKGEAIGLLDGQLMASANSEAEVIQSMADILGAGGFDLATVYCGAETDSVSINGVVKCLESALSSAEVVTVEGGQPRLQLHHIDGIERNRPGNDDKDSYR